MVCQIPFLPFLRNGGFQFSHLIKDIYYGGNHGIDMVTWESKNLELATNRTSNTATSFFSLQMYPAHDIIS